MGTNITPFNFSTMPSTYAPSIVSASTPVPSFVQAPQAPRAAVGIDTTGDGLANVVVMGEDRNRDGVPDILQQSVALPRFQAIQQRIVDPELIRPVPVTAPQVLPIHYESPPRPASPPPNIFERVSALPATQSLPTSLVLGSVLHMVI